MQIINHPLFEALGWTLVHSLWQATLIGILFYLAYQAMNNAPARRRFDLGGFALLSQFILSLGTFLLYLPGAESIGIAEGSASSIAVPASMNFAQASFNWIPVLAAVWSVGAFFCMMRIVSSYWFSKKMIRTAQKMEQPWVATCQQLAKQLGIRQSVQLLSSHLTQVPLTVNHFKPAILFPIGFINQLNPSEVEAILAHELAHIRRHDFLINIFFSFIEALFYFHPAIWWISARMNDAREESCDEVAIALVGNPLHYAKTLVRVQETAMSLWTGPSWSTGMAFSGKKGHMQQRIARILNVKNFQNKKRHRLLAYAIVLLMAGTFWVSTIASTQSPEALSQAIFDNESEDKFYSTATPPEELERLLKAHKQEPALEDNPTQAYDIRVNENRTWVNGVEITSQVETIHPKNRQHVFVNQSPRHRIHPVHKAQLIGAQDTIPSKGSYSYVHNENGVKTELRIKNGEIEKFILDGKKIDPTNYADHLEDIESILDNQPPRPPVPPRAPAPPAFPGIPAPPAPPAPPWPNSGSMGMNDQMSNYESALARAADELAEKAKEMERMAENLASASAEEHSALMESYVAQLEQSSEQFNAMQEELTQELNDGGDAMENYQAHAEQMQAAMEERRAEMEDRRTEMEALREEMNAHMEEQRAEMEEQMSQMHEEMEAERERMHMEHEENWDWHNEVRNELIKDGIIGPNENLNIKFSGNKLKVNGKLLKGEEFKKYKKLLSGDEGRLNNHSEFEMHMNHR